MSKLKVFIITGEVSGDYCGSLLVASLKRMHKGSLDVRGVGGEYLKNVGVDSIFPVSEISVMGISEVIPKIYKISKLINFTVEEIKKFKPDIVVTIDAPGFCFRVVKKLVGMRSEGIKFVHYVSPSVWAYKEERAQKMAKYYDLVLALLPFEPEYYKGTGLRCEYVGHHLVESDWDAYDGAEFRKKNSLPTKDKLLGVFVGSRRTEVVRMLPPFVGALQNFCNENPSFIAVFPVVSENIKKVVSSYLEKTSIRYRVVKVSDENGKIDMMKSFYAALVKSGTSSLEMTFAKIPMIVAYKVSGVTYAIARYIFKIQKKIKYVSLTNLVLGKEVIPEFIQDECTAKKLNIGLEKLVDPKFRRAQIKGYEEVIKILRGGNLGKPSEKSANEIIKLQK